MPGVLGWQGNELRLDVIKCHHSGEVILCQTFRKLLFPVQNRKCSACINRYQVEVFVWIWTRFLRS